MTSEQAEDIKNCLDVLRKGGIILYPTDTVWGLGCNATDADAVSRIFELKRRSDAKALITLVGSEGQLERTVAEVPDVAWQLVEFSEKPLTIIYDRANPAAKLAPALMPAEGTLGVRLTRDEFCAELCRRLGHPLVSTSANISGKPTPSRFDEIDGELVAGVDYACLAGRGKECVSPSTVMRLSGDGLFKILRP